MAEYIEKSDLYNKICEKANNPAIRSWIGSIINDIPAADVAPVVRCKDCLWRGREECAMFYRCDCGEQHTWETDNDFCSYGERKEHANEHQNPPGH